MYLVLSLLLSLSVFSQTRDARLVIEQTFPRDNTFCALKGKRLQVQVRGESKYTDMTENGFGEYALYSFGKKFNLLPLNKDRLDSYRLFTGFPSIKSVCSKSLGFALNDHTIAILFLEENKPMGEKLVIQPFDLAARKPKDVIETEYLTDRAEEAPQGFYFRSLTERLTMDMGKVLIKNEEYTYQDRAFPTWILYTSVGFSVQPSLTFERFNWRRYFKDEADFFSASGWDPISKTFANKVVYYAVNHKAKKTCVLLASQKRKLSNSESWRCL